MTLEIPTTEPTQIQAGDTITWTKSLIDYPASTYTLKYKLISKLNVYNITAASSGDTHIVTVDAATSSSYLYGDYNLISWVESGLTRYTLPSKRVEILRNLAIWDTGLDDRSPAKQTLDLLDAAMVSQGVNAWVQEYQIAGRVMKFHSPSDFLSYRSKVKAEVIREENAAALSSGFKGKNKISVRF